MGRRQAKRRLQEKDESRNPGKSIGGQAAIRQSEGWPLLWQSRWATPLAMGLIVLATVAAYSNSFGGPFIFDDHDSIADNVTIRRLWPPWEALCPPSKGCTASGRPMLNLSLAINYAVSGLDVWSYHVANLGIHILSSLLLFGVLRRTFLLPVAAGTGPFFGAGTGPFFGGTMSLADQRPAENMDLSPSAHQRSAENMDLSPSAHQRPAENMGLSPFAAHATSLALIIALLWAVHPLQTESVTYVIQRAESVVGLFYLLMLYCFIRGADSARSVWWYAGAAAACALGMASKEVMASAPVIALLYDRAFLAGSFRAAWRRRWGLYLILASTWLLLGWFVLLTGYRGGTTGFSSGVHWWTYLCTQFGAIVHYLRLSVWPRGLLFDYDTTIAQGFMEIVPYAIAVALLGATTIVVLWRWPKAGLLGAWFFAILMPSSSVVPVATQTIAEHRMYLPLAAVATAVVIGGFLAGQWLVRRAGISPQLLRIVGGCLAVCVIIALGVLTFQRNADYRSALAIWGDTAAKAPRNARALSGYGLALVKAGNYKEAEVPYRKALEIEPNHKLACNGLGLALAHRGEYDAAMAYFRRVLEIDPRFTEAYNNIGNILATRGEYHAAMEHFQEAQKLNPNYAGTYNNIGVLLMGRGQTDDAIKYFRKALEVNPNCVEAKNNLAALRGTGKGDITDFGGQHGR